MCRVWRAAAEARQYPGRVSRSASLERRVAAAAGEALARQKTVTPVDVCVGIGWLSGSHIESWRYGRVGSLSEFLPVDDARLTQFLDCLSRWAASSGLEPAEAEYVSATRDRRPLRVTAGENADTERAWRTRWISPDLPAAARERVVQRQEKPPDLVVVMPVKDWQCAECGGTGDLLIMDNVGPLCMTCADLDHLVFLGAGDAALTRRAKKGSTLSAVVVRWSRTRKRYERQGILVEEAALEAAEQACLADEDVRLRRRERDRERRAREDVGLQAQMAGEITRLFPRCPPERAEAIARHTALRGSGRVGRSAAGRALDAEALTLAVVASVRHQDTDYDELLMSGVSRDEARDRIRPAIDRLLAAWSLSNSSPAMGPLPSACHKYVPGGTRSTFSGATAGAPMSHSWRRLRRPE